MNPPMADRNHATRKGRVDRRRWPRRYDIALEVRWRLIQGKRPLGAGTGTTLNLSSGGVLFETDRKLASGGAIELAIAWPVLLRNVAPLQLKIMGEIVRAEGRRIAVAIGNYEFRTVGLVWAGPRGTMQEDRVSSRTGSR